MEIQQEQPRKLKFFECDYENHQDYLIYDILSDENHSEHFSILCRKCLNNDKSIKLEKLTMIENFMEIIQDFSQDHDSQMEEYANYIEVLGNIQKNCAKLQDCIQQKMNVYQKYPDMLKKSIEDIYDSENAENQRNAFKQLKNIIEFQENQCKFIIDYEPLSNFSLNYKKIVQYVNPLINEDIQKLQEYSGKSSIVQEKIVKQEEINNMENNIINDEDKEDSEIVISDSEEEEEEEEKDQTKEEEQNQDQYNRLNEQQQDQISDQDQQQQQSSDQQQQQQNQQNLNQNYEISSTQSQQEQSLVLEKSNLSVKNQNNNSNSNSKYGYLFSSSESEDEEQQQQQQKIIIKKKIKKEKERNLYQSGKKDKKLFQEGLGFSTEKNYKEAEKKAFGGY